MKAAAEPVNSPTKTPSSPAIRDGMVISSTMLESCCKRMSRCSFSRLFVAMGQNQKLTQAKRYDGRARQGRSKTPSVAIRQSYRSSASRSRNAPPATRRIRLDFRVLAGVNFDPSSVYSSVFYEYPQPNNTYATTVVVVLLLSVVSTRSLCRGAVNDASFSSAGLPYDDFLRLCRLHVTQCCCAAGGLPHEVAGSDGSWSHFPYMQR